MNTIRLRRDLKDREDLLEDLEGQEDHLEDLVVVGSREDLIFQARLRIYSLSLKTCLVEKGNRRNSRAIKV